MAGSGQKKEIRSARVVPELARGSSRVSKAAGGQGTARVQGAQVEQRSNIPSSRQSGRGQSSARSPQPGKVGARSTRKSPAPVTRRPSPVAVSTPPVNPRDTQFIKWASAKWGSMEAHHQQRVFSAILLVLSLLLFAALTVFRSAPILSDINKFFLTFFGWSAYLLALGLVAFALAHLVEGIRNQHILRWSLVVGLTVIWLLLLIESRLLLGPHVGVLAELLVLPLLGWSSAIGHIVVLGLLLIVSLLTFRITFGHMLIAFMILRRLFGNRPAAPAGRLGGAAATPSPYLGQRPQFSRYASSPGVAAMGGQALARSGRSPMQAAPVEEDEDDGNVDFEADFELEDEDDDPRGDIAMHKPQFGAVQRGVRPPRPLDLSDHATIVQGVKQQPLAFVDVAVDEGQALLKKSPEMEPLAPNPKLVRQQKSRSAVPANGNAALEAAMPSLWKLPELTLLNSPEEVKLQMYGDDTHSLAKVIQDTLRSFRVDAEVRPEDISIGPTIIRFGIRPTGKPEMVKDDKTGKMMPVRDAAGQIVYETRTRVSRIMALQNDLALVLEAKTIRMEAPVPGRPYVGVEVPNKNSRLVTLREVLESKEYQLVKAKSKLSIGLGKDVAGMVRVGDLARMPHLLIAGATGAGKSVMINSIIASIITQATPDDVRMLMVDPKMVELNMYNGIPHLLSPVVIEVEKVVSLLKNAIAEMERRYRQFSQLGVRNLDGYRKLRAEKISSGDTSLGNLPAIVIIIDELADLMMAAPEEVEGMICRLAQLARATGIHLVVATQRPSVDVITGLIKANIPTRISFMVSSAVDSRTIIDMGGAERLLGRGDMLYLPADAGRPERIQGAFLTDDEAQKLADYWRLQMAVSSAGNATPVPAQSHIEPGWELKDEPAEDPELDDDMLDRAEDVVREYGKASISLLQRRLRVGYSRAARLIDLLEERGIIGHSEAGGRGREVYESGGGGYGRAGGDGHSMADEVADIVAEEKARDDFLRKQAAKFQPQPDKEPSTPAYDDDDEES